MKKYSESFIKKETERLEKLRDYENKYEGYIIAGIDEAGRGPLAGPVVAACVVINYKEDIYYLNDSKKVSEKRRYELYDIIIENAYAYGVAEVDEKTIDNINILEATHLAMKKAYEKCDAMYYEKYNDHISCLLVDALKIKNIDILQVPIIKGDSLSFSIAAASILAKVYRDNKMYELDKKYPEYNFKSNKGYGTKEHIEMIKKYGAVDIHRKSFIKNI